MFWPVAIQPMIMQKPKPKKVNAIKAKIKNLNLTINVHLAGVTLAISEYKEDINLALKSENNSLTQEDLAKMTYGSGSLKLGKAALVTATITVGTGVDQATATVDLKVTLAKTNQQKADAIKDKIAEPNITVPVGIDADVTNTDTIKAINIALKAENQGLTADDLKTISYAGGPLVAGQSVTISATIAVGTGASKGTATVDLKVTLAKTNQQKAQALADEFVNNEFFLPAGTDLDFSTQSTTDLITKFLITINPAAGKLITKYNAKLKYPTGNIPSDGTEKSFASPELLWRNFILILKRRFYLLTTFL